MSKQCPSYPSFSREDYQALAVQVLKSCGYGPLLVVGVVDPDLICELLGHGVEVTGLAASPEVLARSEAAVPGRVKTASASAPLDLDQNELFDTVIFFAGSGVPDIWYDDEDLPRQLVRVCRSVLVILLGERDSLEGRSAWAQRLVAAGARRHPLSHELVPYGSKEPFGRALLLYERGPDTAAKLSSRKQLNSFACDFDGEAKSRAARYALATRFVRPGDRVLDSVSLHGDGTYLLSRTTAASIIGWNVDSQAAARAKRIFTSAMNVSLTFERAPPRGMESLASDSFDFIVSDGDSELSDVSWNEAKRVLTPGGRIYVCRRVHEGDVGTIASALRDDLESSGLLLERSWLEHAPTIECDAVIEAHVDELRLADMSPSEGDRVLLLAMKSVANYEPAITQVVSGESGPNVTAFTRDYENPWIVRGLVAMGLRATSVSLRVVMADKILVAAPAGSADRGAALCVRCYAELEQTSSAQALRHWQSLALDFAKAPATNPTALRWQISLLFVAGLMAQSVGDLVLARSTFARIGDHDALAFSPLLGTKTVGAALRSGIIAFANGDQVGARREWVRALIETRRLLRDGDWREILVDTDRPETFGLPEVAAFVMEGARAAGGLRALQDFPDKPSLVWQAMHCTQADLLTAQDLELRSLRKWWGEHDHQRDAWIDELDQAKAWLEKQNSSWQSAAGEKDEQLQALTAQVSQLDEGRNWLEQQLASWQSAAGEKDAQLQALTAQVTQLDEARNWLEQQLASWQTLAGARDSQLRESAGQLSRLRDTIGLAERENAQLSMRQQQSEQRIFAMQGEIHAVVKNSIEESHRLRAIESSRWVRLGRKLGLIQIRE